ncbi:hypothetical protein FO519_004899 [Halicephalobus sp. NKZ332]|nr:hypothetical protein FO519_004899 [Halicephalobus sp. NKZ332]
MDYNYSTTDYNDSNAEIDTPAIHIINNVRYGFLVVQCIGVVIEAIFFFVMAKNWLMKNASLRSAFFYIFTFKTVNDFVYMLYFIVCSYWPEQLYEFSVVIGIPFYIFSAEVDVLCQLSIATNRFTALIMPLKYERTINDFIYILYVVASNYWPDQLCEFSVATGSLYFTFSPEFDTLCQLAISFNRFTALIMPVKHDRMWSSTITVFLLLFIFCFSAMLSFIQNRFYDVNNYSTIPTVDASYRLLLLLVSLIIILIPILKDFYRSKSMNSNSASNASTDTGFTKHKAEKQLLHETIFVCSWKGVNVISFIIYINTEPSIFRTFLTSVIMDSSIFISNVGGLIFLLFISSVARGGFKKAFWIERNRKHLSVITVPNVNNKSTSTK